MVTMWDITDKADELGIVLREYVRFHRAFADEESREWYLESRNIFSSYAVPLDRGVLIGSYDQVYQKLIDGIECINIAITG